MDYLPLIAILTLLLFALLSPLVFLARRSLAVSWLLTLTGALIGWILVLITGLRLPVTISLVTWQPQELLLSSPALLVDRLSWPFALALTSLSLVVILTDVAREFEVNWSAWAGNLALTALGLVAVLAGNPLTLLLGWAALDITELILLMRILQGSAARMQAVSVFSARVIGIFVLLYGQILANAENIQLRFDQFPQSVSVYLLLAAGLRLGVFPLHAPFWQELPSRRGIGTVTRLIPAAASLVFLARVASVGVQGLEAAILMAFTSLAALYAAFSWFSAPDELEGRPYWIFGMAALSLFASILGQPVASLTWGVTLIFSGGLVFLYSARSRWLIVLPIVSIISSLSLPFSATWGGSGIYAFPLSIWHILILVSHAFLLAGIYRHCRRSGEDLRLMERWVWVIYPMGLVLLLVSHYLSALIGTGVVQEGIRFDFESILHDATLVGLIVLASFLARRGLRAPALIRDFFRNVLSFGWFYTILRWFYRQLGSAINFISTILEGEGGILWALLLVTLLIAFLSQDGSLRR